MKYTFLIRLLSASLAVMNAACTSDDTVQDPTTDGTPIAFEEAGRAGTRAAAVTEIADGTAFGVTGYYVRNGAPTSHVAVFDNVAVTRQGDDYIYSPLRYWPLDESLKIRFFAWYPQHTEGLTAEVKYTPELTYTVPEDITRQTDLIYACTKAIHRTNLAGSDEKVPLTFRHALTQLDFAVRLGSDIPQGYHVKVKRIALKAAPTGVMSFGETVAPTDGQISGNGITWTLPEKKEEEEEAFATYQLTTENNGLTTDAEFTKQTAEGQDGLPHQVTDTNYRMYLIPQKMNGSITIDYELANGPDATADGYRYIVNDNVEFELAALGFTLKPGTAVTYTLVIGKYRVSVILNVSDWEDGNPEDKNLFFE